MQSRDHKKCTMTPVVPSKAIGIKGLALAAAVSLQNLVDERLQFASMCFGGSHPPFVLSDLMEHEPSERLLPLFGHLPQPLDGLF
jgi:hypothetical protein